MPSKIIKSLVITTSLIILAGCNNNAGSNANTTTNQLHTSSVQKNTDQNTYLAKPTGQYGVGFKDIHFHDNSRCPDVFYKVGVNESDFSPENANHCREIMARVYYPSNVPVTTGGSYYLPLIQGFKDLVTGAPNVESNDVQEFDSLQSYSFKNATPIKGKSFPIVLFSHGAGGNVEEYENEITNLVSYGYMVVGVNSFFIGDSIALPNGHIVFQDKTASDAAISSTMQSDIMFTYNSLRKIDVIENGDLNNIGIFGHSVGARASSDLIRGNPNLFKAGVSLDDGTYMSDAHDKMVIKDGFNIPFLHVISGQIFSMINNGGASLKFNLYKNNYLVGLAPDDQILKKITPPYYTVHAEFSDENTIKEMPVMKIWIQDYIDATEVDPYSTTDSGYIVNSINTPLVQFFNTYLKGDSNPVFNNNTCEPLSQNTVISCGPTVFPN